MVFPSLEHRCVSGNLKNRHGQPVRRLRVWAVGSICEPPATTGAKENGPHFQGLDVLPRRALQWVHQKASRDQETPF